MSSQLSTKSQSKLAKTDYEKSIAQISDEDQKVAYNPLKLVATIKTDRWIIKQGGQDDPVLRPDGKPAKYEYLDVQILSGRIARVLYLDREQKIPTCTSKDAGIHGSLNFEVAQNQGEASVLKDKQLCSTCPFNQWGSAFDQEGNQTKGKRCKERRNLLALHSEWNSPLVISLSPTSLIRWDAYADALSKQRPQSHSIEHITRIGVEEMHEGGQDFGVAVFSSLQKLTQEQVFAALPLRTEYGDWLGQVVVENEATTKNVSTPPEPPTSDKEITW